MHKPTNVRIQWRWGAAYAGLLLALPYYQFGLAPRLWPHPLSIAARALRVAEATPSDGWPAVRYTVQPLAGGKVLLTPRAINDTGPIAGSIERSDGRSQAF